MRAPVWLFWRWRMSAIPIIMLKCIHPFPESVAKSDARIYLMLSRTQFPLGLWKILFSKALACSFEYEQPAFGRTICLASHCYSLLTALFISRRSWIEINSPSERTVNVPNSHETAWYFPFKQRSFIRSQVDLDGIFTISDTSVEAYGSFLRRRCLLLLSTLGYSRLAASNRVVSSNLLFSSMSYN